MPSGRAKHRRRRRADECKRDLDQAGNHFPPNIPLENALFYFELIEDLGIATFQELAGMLGMAKEELAELWNRLPLDDNEIGARLGVERQQVINLRSAARQRLQRRMSTVPISRKNG